VQRKIEFGEGFLEESARYECLTTCINKACNYHKYR